MFRRFFIGLRGDACRVGRRCRSGGGCDAGCRVVRPGDGVAEGLPDGVEVAEQTEGEGTGSAVLAARDSVNGGTVVVLSGDQPLITADCSKGCSRSTTAGRRGHASHHRPARPGRLRADRSRRRRPRRAHLRDEAHRRPVDGGLAIREINMGTYVFDAADAVRGARPGGPERGERYLTGVFPIIREEGGTIAAHITDDVRRRHGRQRSRRPDGGRGGRPAAS